jgi:tRNA A-37 threonylcarbamoyl transferase component Bud32
VTEWAIEESDAPPTMRAADAIVAEFSVGATLPEEHAGLAELEGLLLAEAPLSEIDPQLRQVSHDGYLRGAVALIAATLRRQPRPQLALRLAGELMDALAPELGADLARAVLAEPEPDATAATRAVSGPVSMLDREGPHVLANLMLADHAREHGDLASALRHFEAVLASDVDHARALLGWSESSRALERRGVSVEHRRRGSALLDGLEELELSAGLGLERYELGRPLGRGRHAVVYEAWDRHVGRAVALKRLLGTRSMRDGPPARVVEARFFAEARTLASVRSPHVIALLDVQPRHRFVALELCRGGNLRLALRRQSVGPADLPRVAHQLRLALEAVHAAGAIHRDVKPANILVRESQPESPIALADFGLAIPHDPKRPQSVSSAGTLRYLAPEVRGGAPATEAADLYSAGVVLLELSLAPRPLSPGFDHVDGVGDVTALVPAELPRELAASIRRLVDADPEKRTW